ncbi:MAG: branched-chain amino acid ABC transporter permease [Ilumatobacter sp.]
MPRRRLRPAERPGWIRLLLAATIAVLGVFSLGSPTAAQDEGEGGATESIGGTLQAEDAEGERIFIEGVTFIVFDSDGNEVGSAVTDSDGVWSVGLPSSGVYSVQLDEATLGEGLSLRNPDRNPLTEIEVQPNTDRATLFPLGERAESTNNSWKIAQLLVDGIKLGLIIAMCAIGLSLIFGTTGLTNFAHGESVTFGAMIAFMFHMVYGAAADFEFFGIFKIWSNGRLLGVPGTNSLIFAGIVAVIISGLSGWLFNEFVWKRLRNRGASLISALVVSIGLSIFFRYVFLFQYRGRARFYRDFQIQPARDYGVFSLADKDLFIILFSIFVLVCVGLALQKTRAGKAMRAVADNRDLAESSGIDVESVIKWVWITGSALAGLGGVLFGMTENVNWEMGFRLLLLMFAGVTLGGLGTAYGALAGSLIVGVFIQVITWPEWFPNDMKNVGALAALVLILLVRPQGLLGRSERIG